MLEIQVILSGGNFYHLDILNLGIFLFEMKENLYLERRTSGRNNKKC